MRKERNEKIDFTSVKFKWTGKFCTNPILKNEIEGFVWNTNKVALEAYHVANLHILRCLSEKIQLPVLNQSFFYRCCSSVLENPPADESYLRQTKSDETKDSDLNDTLEIYKSLRPQNSYKPPVFGSMTALMSNLARQMVTECKNHLALNFGKRVLKYIRLKYQKTSKEAWQFVNDSFDDEFTKTPEHNEFVKWIEIVPNEYNIKRNLRHFLEKSYDILGFMETQPPFVKMARKFTLLPLKTSYVMSHVHICSSSLCQIMQNLLRQDKNIFSFGDNKLDLKTFLVLKDSIWREFFNIEAYETATRKFHHEISTDGYSVVIKLRKPKHIQETEDDQDENPGQMDLEVADQEIPNIQDYDRFIGADPGIINVLTANTSSGEFIKISTEEYRHMAQMKKQQYWDKNLRKRDSRYNDLITKMPSFKTTSIETYIEGLTYVLSVCDHLLLYCAEKSFRKWRFKTFIYTKKALNKLCLRLTAGMKTCIGIGDWSNKGCIIKRHSPAPVKKIQRELKRYAKVVSLDEYGTSRGCSSCGSRCTNLRFYKITKDYELKFPYCHEIVRCSSNECAITWQRDINSSINHLKLLNCLLSGLDRPDYMKRGKRSETFT